MTMFVLMPETAPHLYDFLQPRKDEVGLAGKMGDMKPVPETHSMNKSPDKQFGRRILRTD
jgi:hypothetical protein